MADLKEYNHVDLLFPSKYFKAADLRGDKVTVTIQGIDPRGELQVRGGRKEYKPVVTFAEIEKLWVLNKTNAISIMQLYGPEVTEWIGKPIILQSAKVAFGNKIVDAVRVVDEIPKPAGNKLRTANESDAALEEFMALLSELHPEELKKIKLDKMLGDREKIRELGAERISGGIEFLKKLLKEGA